MSTPKRRPVDRPFLILALILTVGGFLIFTSAAMSVLVREDLTFGSLMITQLAALILGLIALTAISWLHYSAWKQISLPLFLTGIGITLLLFVPGLGVEHGGAVRWLNMGPISFQPAELLKMGFILYCAAWLSGVQKKIHLRAYGLIPLCLLFLLTGSLLLLQPDTNSFVFIVVAGVAMFFAAGARIRDVLILKAVGIAGFLMLLTLRPYVRERIVTLFHRDVDVLDASYQLQQSLIAVGSGEIWGRGFGQSIQKFNFLPEAMGDSVFAVAAEELGFLGSLLIIALFVTLLFRGLQIASRVTDIFARLTVIGIVILITVQSFSNIAGMIGVFPLSGTPLMFISHGGSALVMALIMVGIILNISRYQKLPARETVRSKNQALTNQT